MVGGMEPTGGWVGRCVGGDGPKGASQLAPVLQRGGTCKPRTAPPTCHVSIVQDAVPLPNVLLNNLRMRLVAHLRLPQGVQLHSVPACGGGEGSRGEAWAAAGHEGEQACLPPRYSCCTVRGPHARAHTPRPLQAQRVAAVDHSVRRGDGGHGGAARVACRVGGRAGRRRVDRASPPGITAPWRWPPPHSAHTTRWQARTNEVKEGRHGAVERQRRPEPRHQRCFDARVGAVAKRVVEGA